MTNESEPSQVDDAHWERLASYLSDEARGDETTAIRNWLSANSTEAASLEVLSGAIERIAVVPDRQIDIDAALRQSAALRRSRSMLPFEGRRRAGSAPRARWIPILRAAAALAVIATGSLLWRAVENRPGPSVASVFRADGLTPDTVHLPDGSVAILAPHSELRLAADFGRGERRVELTGLGYFDLAPAGGAPFIVTAGDAEIRDIGTVFTVRSDPRDGVRVAVHEGMVIVRGGGTSADGLVLRAGDHATVGPKAEIARGGVSSDELQWTRGQLVFRDAPAGEVARDVGRWYGISLQLSAALANRAVNTDLSGQPLSQVIRTLELALGARAVTIGDTVRLEVREATPR
jgi:transmembrane sensor